MARGAIVQNGVAVSIIEAASGYDPNYQGAGIAFVPYSFAQVGDLWDGANWTYNMAPAAVSPLQFRLALDQLGLRAAAQSYVSSAPQNVQDWWNFTASFQIGDAMLVSLASAIGQSPAQIAAAFRLASTL